MATRNLGARSSLLNHEFPLFYACYLLKSINPPLSPSATYIGSTPDPPRRIRQHNGQLQAGARRTESKRPWVMQMIVHGFPSKLAALQFEWAWQHPHKSRHFRDENGRIFGNRATKHIGKLIKVVHTMITRHPFNTWPLHVKLFTEEAVKIWTAVSAPKRAPPMPIGFTCSIELEGVDGKSGNPGSGRKAPIAVKDVDFTNTHLAKHTSLLATRRRLKCNICQKPMDTYATEPLEMSLCPSLHCTAVSHLSCLSQYFLTSEAANKQNQNKSEFIPRGGNCKTCRNYILWGDVIRGSYRRFRAIQKPQDGADNTVDEDDLFVSDEEDGLSEVNEDGTPIKVKKKGSKKSRSTSRSSRRKSVGKKTTKSVSSRSRNKSSSNSSGESFDFDNISSSSGDDPSTLRRRGRPPKTIQVPSSLVLTKRAAKTKNVESVRRSPGRPRKGTTHSTSDDALESLNSNSEAGSISPKRKPGRPSRSKDLPSRNVHVPIASPPSSLKRTRKGKGKATDPQETFTMDDLKAALPIIGDTLKLKKGPSSGSYLGSTLTKKDKRQRSPLKKSSSSHTSSRVSSSAEDPARRKPGRPRKTGFSPISTNAAYPRTSRQVQGPEASPVISSNSTKPDNITKSRGRPRSSNSPGTPIRKRGRPMKTDLESSSSNDLIIISDKRRPGRPRKEKDPQSLPTLVPSSKHNITSRSGSASDKRKPGRPRKEKDPQSGLTLNDCVPIRQKPAGRTSALISSTSPSSANSRISTVSSKKRMHTQAARHGDSSSGESFDFTGLSDEEASDEDFELYLARIAKRLKG